MFIQIKDVKQAALTAKERKNFKLTLAKLVNDVKQLTGDATLKN